MANRKSVDVTIVGAGLVGSLAAIALRRRGMAVRVFESRDDPRLAGDAGGRSINLVVAARGILPLERFGLWDRVRELTVPVSGRMMHSPSGDRSYQPYGRDETECNWSVPRGALNRFLVDEAEARGVRFEFGRRLVDADLDNGRLRFEGDVELDAALVLGADGAGSAVRAAMQRLAGFEESIQPLGYGYKELTIPPAAGGGYRIEGRALHIWPRGRVMLMALPNRDGSFTVTLYLPLSGPDGFDRIADAASVTRLFDEQFPDAVPLIDDLAGSFAAHPTGSLATVRCHPWTHRGRVALIGDAAHAIVPFFGQGMNCGFEDCRVLDDLIERHGLDDLPRLLGKYGDSRKADADAIADMALDNFVEMRDRVADPAFLLRKQVEHVLEERLPADYRSRYSMVMYGASVPYRIALEAGRIQQRLLDELCRDLEEPSRVDTERARLLIRDRLRPFLLEHGIRLDY